MGIAVVPFSNNGRDVQPEIDRKYNLEEIPSCAASAQSGVTIQMGSSSAPSSMQGGHPVIAVTATEFTFDPAVVTLKAGQTVTIHFTNAGTMEHTLTIPDFHLSTGGILPGHSRDLTFTAPAAAGSHKALCAMGGHEQLGMVASVVVQK